MRLYTIAAVLIMVPVLSGCLHPFPASPDYPSSSPFTEQEMETALMDLQQLLEQAQSGGEDNDRVSLTTIMPDRSTLVLDMRMDRYRSLDSGNSYTGWYRIETRLADQQIKSHTIRIHVEISPSDHILEVSAVIDAAGEQLDQLQVTVDRRAGDFDGVVEALLLQRQ